MSELNKTIRSKPNVMNPIWVISLFLGLSEVTTGVVATQSHDWVQAVFTIFSVAFPCVVMALFFIVLWKKPYVLYAPRDFAESVDVVAFVDAMSKSVRRGVEVAQSAAASSAEVMATGFQLNGGETEILVQRAKDAAEESVLLAVAKVDLSKFLGAGSTLEFIVSESSSVSELLDAIYASLSRYVAPYTYGVSWLIKIKETGQSLPDIGTNWAMNNGLGNSDTRLLHEIGIEGGAEIDLVDMRRPYAS